MRAALALYAIRFGGWLLAKASGCYVVVGVDIWNDPDGDGESFHLEKEYVA